MSEPSTNIPGEVADAQVDQDGEGTEATPSGAPEKVELDLDEDKLEAWDAVKSDYQVDPEAEDASPGTDEEQTPEGNATD